MSEHDAPTAVPRPLRSQLIFSVARAVHDPRASTGAHASLRRGTRHDVVRQAAFHHVIAEVPDDQLGLDALSRWAAVVQCIALTAIGTSVGPSDGSALANAGLSETRFSRLLASRGDGFFDQLLLIARYLRAKQTPVRWNDLGELALTIDVQETRADALRLRLARDFYRVVSNPLAS